MAFCDDVIVVRPRQGLVCMRSYNCRGLDIYHYKVIIVWVGGWGGAEGYSKQPLKNMIHKLVCMIDKMVCNWNISVCICIYL